MDRATVQQYRPAATDRPVMEAVAMAVHATEAVATEAHAMEVAATVHVRVAHATAHHVRVAKVACSLGFAHASRHATIL